VNEPIDPVRRAAGARRTRGRRAGDAPAADAVQAPPEPAGPAPAPPPQQQDSTHAIAAQIIGQAAADSADGPAKTAEKAANAYRQVEWSGAADRRNRRGRIAKTQI
jgi:hypothetical protein